MFYKLEQKAVRLHNITTRKTVETDVAYFETGILRRHLEATETENHKIYIFEHYRQKYVLTCVTRFITHVSAVLGKNAKKNSLFLDI